MENQQLRATIEREIQARQTTEQHLKDIEENLNEKLKFVRGKFNLKKKKNFLEKSIE